MNPKPNFPFDPAGPKYDAITEGLIIGFPKLDQMQYEIEQLVGRLVGLAQKCPKGEAFEKNLWSPSSWNFYWKVRRDNKGKVSVQCMRGRRFNSALNVLETVYSTDPERFVTDNATQLALDNIQLIHQSLSLLVAGMYKEFPVLTLLLHPVLNAASGD